MKKLILILLLCFIVFIPTTVQAADVELKAGDYLYFGTYNNDPIKWRVLQLESNKALLLADVDICRKAFDAAESGTSGSSQGAPDFLYSGVYANGSSNWASSNIREWLNSDESTVRYSTAPPTDAAIESFDGLPDGYEKEKGFLTNFTDTERSMITAHQFQQVHVLYSDDPGSEKTYGSGLPTAGVAVERSLSDRVFLLSSEEYMNFVDPIYARNIYGTFFLRDPGVFQYTNILLDYTQTRGEYFGQNIHSNTVSGIRPGMYVTFSPKYFASGKGTAESPYSNTAANSQAPEEPAGSELTDDSYKITYKGDPLQYYMQPIEVDGVMYLPAMDLMREMGWSIFWEPVKKYAKAQLGKKTIILYPNSKVYKINNKKYSLDRNSIDPYDSGNIYVTSSFFKKALNCSVTIDKKKKEILIKPISKKGR